MFAFMLCGMIEKVSQALNFIEEAFLYKHKKSIIQYQWPIIV